MTAPKRAQSSNAMVPLLWRWSFALRQAYCLHRANPRSFDVAQQQTRPRPLLSLSLTADKKPTSRTHAHAKVKALPPSPPRSPSRMANRKASPCSCTARASRCRNCASKGSERERSHTGASCVACPPQYGEQPLWCVVARGFLLRQPATAGASSRCQWAVPTSKSTRNASRA